MEISMTWLIDDDKQAEQLMKLGAILITRIDGIYVFKYNDHFQELLDEIGYILEY